MRTVEDIFAHDIDIRTNSIETVAGFLLVSQHLVCLCQSNELRDKAILVVAPGLKKKWEHEIPPYAGTMVAYAGEATVTGKLARSGVAPLPYAFHEVHRITFQGPGGLTAVYEPEGA